MLGLSEEEATAALPAKQPTAALSRRRCRRADRVLCSDAAGEIRGAAMSIDGVLCAQ